MKFELETADAEAIAEALFIKLAPAIANGVSLSRALMSCSHAGKDLGISGEKVRALVEAGIIDRVPGFAVIKISPEALAKYRATAAPK